MGDPSDIGALTLAVGEMRGQMRELIHAQNNMAMKLEGLTEKVLLAQALPAEVARLGDVVAGVSARVDALEAVNDRQDGAKGVLATLLGSKAFGVLVSATLVLYASIKEGLFK
jgi:hypothetical protein